jgi:translation initiation factor IF-2
MADATISELAGVVGVSVDKLLSQIKEAGLPHSKAKDTISNDDKNTLLLSLRRSHGDKEATDGAPKKITLKRKTIATLKSASTHGRGKTVNVEVRKKRTYVKRSTIVDDTSAVEEELENLVTAKADAETDVSAAAQETADQVKADVTTVDTEAAGEAQPEATVAQEAPPPEEGRATKSGAKRKTQAKTDDAGEKKTHLRNKAKAQAPKRQAKTIHVNDDFVLEGDDFDEIGGRGRRASGRRGKARIAAQQHAFEKPTEFIAREIVIAETNSVSDLAQKMSVKSAEIVKVLFNM